jgi:hypothetical protein
VYSTRFYECTKQSQENILSESWIPGLIFHEKEGAHQENQDYESRTMYREKYTADMMAAYEHPVSVTGAGEQKTTRKNTYKPMVYEYARYTKYK